MVVVVGYGSGPVESLPSRYYLPFCVKTRNTL
jgi:hypothetical protein